MQDKLIANKAFENVANLKYFWTVLIKQNCIYEEIRNRLNLGSVATFQLESSFFLSPLKKLKD
jgi:hypothetical protein